MSEPPRRVALATAILLILLPTPMPVGSPARRFFSGFDWSGLLVNVLLFLPLGYLLAGERFSPLAIAVIAIGFSGCVELLQGTVIPGRRGSPVDIASNFLGAMGGLRLQRLWEELSRR